MAKQAKRSANKPEMKINGILVGLIASVIINLLLAAPYVAFLTTRQFDMTAGDVFFARVFDAPIENIEGRSWSCAKPEYVPYWASKNQRFCYGVIILDENNQEVK